MSIKIAVALAITAGAFMIDAAATGQSLRLTGALVAAGLAWWLISSSRVGSDT